MYAIKVRTDIHEKAIFLEFEASVYYVKLTPDAARTLGEELIREAETLKELV